jgi:hypothetical protein
MFNVYRLRKVLRKRVSPHACVYWLQLLQAIVPGEVSLFRTLIYETERTNSLKKVFIK